MKKSIVSILVFFGMQVLFEILIIVAFILVLTDGITDIATLKDFLKEYNNAITIWTMITSDAAILILLWALRYYHPKDIVKSVDFGTVCVCIGLIISGIFFSNIFNAILNLKDNTHDTFMQVSESLWGVFSIGILGPVVEEIVFRRILITELHAKYSGSYWPAIIISALIFGLIHMNPGQMVFAFLLGLVFGWIYCRTGSILASVIGHIINNLITILVMRFYHLNGLDQLEELEPAGREILQSPDYMSAFALSFVCAIAFAVMLVRRTKVQSQYQSENPEPMPE